MSDHTPTPWSLGHNARSVIREVPGMSDGCDHYMVCVLSAHSLLAPPEAQANAALIVRAVNRDHHFDALVKALEELLALPTSLRELAMLDKGIGTATPLAAWLRARDLVSRDVGSPLTPSEGK